MVDNESKIAELMALLNSVKAIVEGNENFANNMQGDGNIIVENGKMSLIVTSGEPGPTGKRGPTGFGVTGPPGDDTTGPTGITHSNPGKQGITGPQGVTGPTSSKESVIRVPIGNVAFSCFENARPRLFEVYRGIAPCVVDLSSRLCASVVADSLGVWSLVRKKAVPMGARIEGQKLIVDGEESEFTAVVDGIHKEFPGWDAPLVDDEKRNRSHAFWSREHR